MPATATAPAARAFPRGAAIPISARWSIPAEPSASTARRLTVFTIPIISVRRSMWTSRDAGHATAGERNVRPLRRNKTADHFMTELL